MLDTLISSKTRIKLLTRLFLNPSSSAYLRRLAEDFRESTNAVRLELNRFEDAGMLLSETQGNKKIFKANEKHPLFKDINNIVLKYVGIDKIVEIVIGRLGDLDQLYLSGDYAEGKDTGIIDLIFVGAIDKSYLVKLIEKAENLIHKKVRYIHYVCEEEFNETMRFTDRAKYLPLWKKTMGNG